MLKILTELAQKSRWDLTAFNGKLHLSGRILSPMEAQAAGIASKTLMMKMYQTMEGKETIPGDEEANEDHELLKRIEQLKPEDLLDFGTMQDRVICQVTDKVSEDGEKFEKIAFVPNEGQQNPSRNRLWVGLLGQDDKNAIFEAAMISVQEVADSGESFSE